MSLNDLWKISDAIKAMEVDGGHVLEGPVNGISIDSRTVAADDLFFAILGDQLDGHDYVEKALNAGARAAVISKRVEGVSPDKLILVPDTLEALNKLGRAARTRSDAKIIAITGSVGKTGTKEALLMALDTCGKVHAAVASFNNHWGVPLTLARCPDDRDFGIFEIGMNHSGEITPLVNMVRPHIAIITNVAPVHLAHFANVDEIATAKAEIFSGIEPNGTAILNRDNAYFDYLAAAAGGAGVAKIISVGEHKDANVRLLSCTLEPDKSVVQVDVFGENVSFEIGAPGMHFVLNSLAVLAAVKEAGGDVAMAASALKGWTAPVGRGERHTLNVAGKTAVLIDEIFNANPTSMRAAIATLGTSQPLGSGRRIAVIGDMLELGDTAQEIHRGLLAPLIEADVDLVFAVGPLMEELWQDLPASIQGEYVQKAPDLIEKLVETVQPGDVVMIKGSKGTKMNPLVDALLTHFR